MQRLLDVRYFIQEKAIKTKEENDSHRAMGDNLSNNNNNNNNDDDNPLKNNFVSVYDMQIDECLPVQQTGQNVASLQIPLTALEKEAHAVFRQQIADGVPFSFDWTARENDSAQRKA